MYDIFERMKGDPWMFFKSKTYHKDEIDDLTSKIASLRRKKANLETELNRENQLNNNNSSNNNNNSDINSNSIGTDISTKLNTKQDDEARPRHIITQYEYEIKEAEISKKRLQSVKEIMRIKEEIIAVLVYKSIWHQKWLQSIYTQRSVLKFWLMDNMDFYCNSKHLYYYLYGYNLEGDLDNDKRYHEYRYNYNDYLHACRRTSGITKHEFKYELEENKMVYNMCIYDVGGQRSERRKWIHTFDRKECLLYVTGLNEYCSVLFEDENVNAMWEALNLLDCILSSGKWFASYYTQVILLFGKRDLYEKAISSGLVKLGDCFDANKKTHPNAWFKDAYNDKVSKYKGKEWTSKEDKLNSDVNDINMVMDDSRFQLFFQDVIEEQIAFIVQRFETIAQNHGKIRNETLFSYVVSGIDEKQMSQTCDSILQRVIHSQRTLANLN